ncbi:MAG: site-2 protease family protein [Gammaproteobacteria bacterium]|nr:MAG: site-2 protease family protein [Gammaproteobacteria bacterium]
MPEFDLAVAFRGVAAGAIPVLFAITLHEVAHGWAARALGDRTAEMLGRLSLNPLRHVDPVGTVLVPLLVYVLSGFSFLFGWARPVPVNPRSLRWPKQGMVLVAAAGPAANLAMGACWAAIAIWSQRLLPESSGLAQFLFSAGQIGVLFNAILAVFNLIPLPPLDGGRVLRGLVPEAIGYYLDRIEPFGLIIILLLLWVGPVWPLLAPVIRSAQLLMFALAGAGGS